MDPVAKKSYAPLYFQTQANLAELEEMAAEYERASKAVSPKAMPTTTAPTTTGKAPVVDLEESAAQPPEAKPPEALPSSGSAARLGEMPVFFLTVGVNLWTGLARGSTLLGAVLIICFC